mmetsp:Transcript_2312/g.4058  ORF Transcript_2312/g.4058 Transcript_2312/m.4058 type:complete len:146 (-) Transcript_2312:242-679(-)
MENEYEMSGRLLTPSDRRKKSLRGPQKLYLFESCNTIESEEQNALLSPGRCEIRLRTESGSLDELERCRSPSSTRSTGSHHRRESLFSPSGNKKQLFNNKGLRKGSRHLDVSSELQPRDINVVLKSPTRSLSSLPEWQQFAKNSL